MIEAAERAGVRLMVGTMKRYDPAYQRLLELLPDVDDLRMVRVTTLESPLASPTFVTIRWCTERRARLCARGATRG